MSPPELWLPVEINFDARGLPQREKRFLRALIEASDAMEEAFLRQMGRSPRGEGQPVAEALYPPDLTRAEFEAYLEQHPDQREALLSPYTVVRRRGDDLIAVPYHEEYRPQVERAARALREAAELAGGPSLQKYLAGRAEALLGDDYYQSDVDWINVADSAYEVIIGPYEVYFDRLMGVKAAYMSVVGRVDVEASRKLAAYSQYLPQLEESLPYPRPQGHTDRAKANAFAIVRDLYRAGDIRYGFQAIANNLPNDPRVISEYGSKKTFFMNMMEVKLQRIVRPLVEPLLDQDQLPHFNLEADFMRVLFHEIAHALGPRWVARDGQRISVNEALKERYSALEEGKADLVGFYSARQLIRQGVIPAQRELELQVAHLTARLRTIRHGVEQAHGLASVIQLNHHLRSGAFEYDGTTGRFRVDGPRLNDSVRELMERSLALEALGDYEEVGRLYAEYGRPPDVVRAALERTAHVPVDVRPTYRILWE